MSGIKIGQVYFFGFVTQMDKINVHKKRSVFLDPNA